MPEATLRTKDLPPDDPLRLWLEARSIEHVTRDINLPIAKPRHSTRLLAQPAQHLPLPSAPST